MASPQGINLVLGTDNVQLVIPQNTTNTFNIFVPAVGAYNGKVTLQASSVTPVNNNNTWAGTINFYPSPSGTPPFLCQVQVNPLNTFAPINGSTQWQVTIFGSAPGATVVPVTLSIIVQQNPGTALGGKFYQNIISNPNQPAELNIETLQSNIQNNFPVNGASNQIKVIFHVQLQAWLAFYAATDINFNPYIVCQASYDTVNWQPPLNVSKFYNLGSAYVAAPADPSGNALDSQFSVYYDVNTGYVWFEVANANPNSPLAYPYGIMVYYVQFYKGSNGNVQAGAGGELIAIVNDQSQIIPSQPGAPFGWPSLVVTGNTNPSIGCFSAAAFDLSAQAWHVKAWYLSANSNNITYYITYDRTLPSANPRSPPIILYNPTAGQNTIALCYVYDNYTVTFVPSNNFGSSWLAGINSVNNNYNPVTLSPCPIPFGDLMVVGCINNNNVPYSLVYNSQENVILQETNILGQNVQKSSVGDLIINYDANLDVLVALFTVGYGYGQATGFNTAVSPNGGQTWVVTNASIPNPVGNIVTGSLVNGVIEVGSQNDNWEVIFAGILNFTYTINVMSLNVNVLVGALQGAYNGSLNFVTLSHAEGITSRTFSIILYPINTGGANTNSTYYSNPLYYYVYVFPNSNNAFSNISIKIFDVADPGRTILGNKNPPGAFFELFSRDEPAIIPITVYYNNYKIPPGATTKGLALFEIQFTDTVTGANLYMGLLVNVLD
jgi:hypothetical protein